MGFITAFSDTAKAAAIPENPINRAKKARAELKKANYRRDFSRCPRCGAPTARAKAYNGADSEFWLECTQCNTFINTYIPQPHQFEFHKDPHRYTANFGGRKSVAT